MRSRSFLAGWSPRFSGGAGAARLGLVLVVFVAVVLFFAWPRGEEPNSTAEGHENRPVDSSLSAGGIEVASEAGAGARAVDTDPSGQRQTNSEDNRVPDLLVDVQDEEGRPVPGASVRLVRASGGLAGRHVPTAGVSPPWPSLATEDADQNGQVRFDREVLGTEGLAQLWVQGGAPGYQSAQEALGERTLPTSLRLVLARGETFEVQVLDGEDRPVAGALVRQRSLEDTEQGAPPWTMDAITDASGRVRCTRPQGEVWIQAQKDSLLSRPWRGEKPDSISLRLLETVSVEGRIVPTATMDFVPGAWMVSISREHGAVREVLHSELLGQLEFGPWLVPWDQGLPLDVILEGEGVVTTLERVIPTAPGHTSFVELEAEPGAEFLGRVSSEQGEDIANATATLSWQDDDKTWVSFTVEGDERGYFETRSAPATFVTVQFAAPGYYPATRSNAFLPNSDSRLWVGLKPAASIAGRVMRSDGRPAHSFDILAWRRGEPRSRQKLEVHWSADGAFEFPAAPEGEIYVVAASQASPGSQVVAIRSGTEEASQVELTLWDARPLSGTVVTREGGAPVAGARVQLTTPGPDGVVAFWGAPLLTGAAGRFDAIGLIPTRSWILVEKEGYQSLFREFNPPADGPLDLGQLALSRVYPLRVLVRAEKGSDQPPPGSAEWSVSGITGGVSIPNTPIGPDGEVVLENVGPGYLTVGVFRTDTQGLHSVEWTFPSQPTEEERVVEFLEGGGKSLTITLLEADGSPYLGRAVVLLHSLDGGRREYWQYQVEHGRVGTVEGLYVDRVSVTIKAEDFKTILATREVFLRGETQEMGITLGGEKTHLLIEDADGRAVPRAAVGIKQQDDPIWYYSSTTDEDGIAELQGVKPGLYRASVALQSGARYSGLEVDLREVPEALLTLGDTGTLEVLCHDAGEPLPEAAVTIFDSMGVPSVQAASDPEGTATFPSFGQGRYLIQVTGEGLWPARQEHSFSPTGGPLEQQVFRTGALTLRLTDSDGNPQIHVPVQLTWLEQDRSVEEWIAQGLLADGSLVTDSSGAVRLESVPRGTYRWSTSTATGGTGSGTFEVPPGVHFEATGRIQ